MTADDVAAREEISQLAGAHEAGRPDSVCRDVKKTTPAALLEQRGRVGVGGHSAVVECQEDGEASGRATADRTRRVHGARRERYSGEVLCELAAVELVDVRAWPVETARRDIAVRHNVVVHERDCSAAALAGCGFRTGPSNFIFAASKKLAALLDPWSAHVGRIHLTRGDGDGPIHL